MGSSGELVKACSVARRTFATASAMVVTIEQLWPDETHSFACYVGDLRRHFDHP
jgi:hypothetical protein